MDDEKEDEMSEDIITEMKRKWLVQCGSCDAGGCTCVALGGDPRTDIARLVAVLEDAMNHAAHEREQAASGCSKCLHVVLDMGVEAGVETAFTFVENALRQAGHLEAAEFVRTGGAR